MDEAKRRSMAAASLAAAAVLAGCAGEPTAPAAPPADAALQAVLTDLQASVEPGEPVVLRPQGFSSFFHS